MPDLVDFASAFPDNAADEIVGDKDLLRLKLVLLLRGVVLGRGGRVVHVKSRMSGDIGGGHPGRPTCITRRPIARMRKRRHAFVCFDEDVPNVVRRDVDSVRDTRDAQDTLQNREISTRKIKMGKVQPLSSLVACPHLRSIVHHSRLEFP